MATSPRPPDEEIIAAVTSRGDWSTKTRAHRWDHAVHCVVQALSTTQHEAAQWLTAAVTAPGSPLVLVRADSTPTVRAAAGTVLLEQMPGWDARTARWLAFRPGDGQLCPVEEVDKARSRSLAWLVRAEHLAAMADDIRRQLSHQDV